MNAVAIEHRIEDLIRRELPAASRGDTRAYGRIVAASQNTVTAVALAITRDVATSEDIAQEAFFNAWQNLRRLQNPASFLPWLRQITRNLAHDHLRGQGRRPRPVDDADAAIEAAADPDPTPCERLIEDERQAVAVELISALPDDSREVLLLYYREGQSSQQVARLLGLSDAAVRKRLSRARASVREDLLRRFGEFARSSAPGTAFAALVTGMLGGVSKPASAMGMAAAGSTVATTFGKALLGGLGGFASGVVGGLVALYFGHRYLLGFADDDAERKAIGRWMRTYVVSSVGFTLAAFVVALLTRGWEGVVAATIAVLVVINYQVLGTLPRLMNPMLDRDARRRPAGAGRRRLVYRLVWGSSGMLIANIGLLGGMGLAMLASGRFG